MVQMQNIEMEDKPDVTQAINVLNDVNSGAKQLTDVIDNLIHGIQAGELVTENGLSFLEVKYQLLLNYLINLTYIMLRKCHGQKIENDPSIERLIRIKTILEKIRPIDYKLRYQIDKLIKKAVTGGSSGAFDPISFKANPSNLLSGQQMSDEETSDESEDDSKKFKKKKKSKAGEDEPVEKYVPPKLISMAYDDETGAAKDEKAKERMQKRAYNSSMIEEWKEEFLDTPVEVTGSSRAHQMISKAQKEKEEFEENYFVRLPVSKAEKHRQKRLSTLGTLGDELTRFNDTGDLDRKSSKGNRKRKMKNKKYGKRRKAH